MSPLIKLCTTADLPAEGQAKEFQCGAKTLCVTRLDGTVSALEGVCPHRGGPLGQGVIEEGKVVCPWHGWQFDAKTGAVGDDEDGVPTYPVTINGDDVFVEI